MRLRIWSLEDTREKRQRHLCFDGEVGVAVKGRLNSPGRSSRVVGADVAALKLEKRFGRKSVDKMDLLLNQGRAFGENFGYVLIVANGGRRDRIGDSTWGSSRNR